MEFQGLKFHSLKMSSNTGLKAGKVGENSKLGSAIQLVQMGMLKLNDFGTQWNIKNKLKKLSKKIKDAKGDNLGVLVVAKIEEWEDPDPTGARAKSVYSVYIAEAGNDYRTVFRKYHSRLNLSQGPHDGWRHHSTEYIWVTEN